MSRSRKKRKSQIKHVIIIVRNIFFAIKIVVKEKKKKKEIELREKKFFFCFVVKFIYLFQFFSCIDFYLFVT